jgi:hypothetical protein
MGIVRRTRQLWRNLVLGPWDPADPGLWPNAAQALLLRALVLDGEAAACAWREWRADHQLENTGHGELALFPSLFLKAEPLGIEADARATLRQHYAAAWARNQKALGCLTEAFGLLAAAGVSAIALKGSPLLLCYYGDAGARPMADVDVLIRQADLPRAVDALAADGWRTERGLPPREVLANIHAVEWTHRSGLNLDLHWRPFTPDCPAAAEERLWTQSETRRTQRGEVRLPCAADLLILMCFHGRKPDPVSACRWALDVARIIERAEPPIDWEYVLEQCKETGLVLPVRDALLFVARELGAAVPGDFLRAIAGVTVGPSDVARYHALARGPRRRRGLAEVVAVQWWRYAAVGRSRGRRPSVAGFARYYLARKQWEWDLKHKWQVPVRAVQAAIERVRAHGW